MATAIGSLPHADARAALDLIFKRIPQVPCWPQLPKRAPAEDMIPQFIEGLPGVVWLAAERRFFFNTEAPVFDEGIVHFYERYLAVNDEKDMKLLEDFAISPKHSAGFYAFQERLWLMDDLSGIKCLKGQVTGPVTFGLGLPDQTGKASFYSEQLRDIIVKQAAMKAIWQIEKLREFGKKTIIFLDEPALSSFGSSAMIGVSRENVIEALTEVIEAVHSYDGLAGIHCCGNTDWSMILETPVDILSLDAYLYGDTLFLYPEELTEFIRRGGTIAWGIVPTSETAAKETAEALVFKYESHIKHLADHGISEETARVASMFTPSCGTGTMSQAQAEAVFDMLQAVASHFTGG